MIEAKYTPTPYSPEGRITSKLRSLGCSESAFSKLCDGIIGKTRLNQGLTDSRRSLENPIAERLFEKLAQMESLQSDVNQAVTKQGLDPVPIAWEKTELISLALTARLIHSIEHDSGNDELQSVSDRATKAVGTDVESSVKTLIQQAIEAFPNRVGGTICSHIITAPEFKRMNETEVKNETETLVA